MRIKKIDLLDFTVIVIIILFGLIVSALGYIRARQFIKTTVSKQRLVYLAPAFGVSDLYLLDPNSSAPPERLTKEDFGVYDFSVNKTGNLLAYSADRDNTQRNRDIWVLNLETRQRQLVVECTQILCATPSWAADGSLLAYEKRQSVDSANTEIWLADLIRKTNVPLILNTPENAPAQGVFPKWSPSANQLAYFDSAHEQIIIVQLNMLDVTVSTIDVIDSVPNPLFAWSQDGYQMAYVQHQVDDALNRQMLMRADFSRGMIEPIGEFMDRQFSQPVWSNTMSTRLAVSMRDKLSNGSSSVLNGQQIWVIEPIKNTNLPITQRMNSDYYSYGGLKWSGNDNWIVAVRNTASFLGEPEIWLVRSDGGDMRLIAQNATLPDWVR
jgi:Tol biopolymer transport system component